MRNSQFACLIGFSLISPHVNVVISTVAAFAFFIIAIGIKD